MLAPWRPRGVEIRGRAEAIESGGNDSTAGVADALIRVHPVRIIAWGIDTDPYERNSRDVR